MQERRLHNTVAKPLQRRKQTKKSFDRLKLFAYATREKWPKKQLNSENNSKDALTRVS